MSVNVLKSKTLKELSQIADELLLGNDHEKLKIFFNSHSEAEHIFENLIDEAHFYYMLEGVQNSVSVNLTRF